MAKIILKRNLSSSGPISDKFVKYLGIDWGEKRIGLSIADSETKIATPYKVVSSLDKAVEVVQEEEISVIIVGQPLKMQDACLRRQAKFKMQDEFLEFLQSLKERTKIPIKTVDERLSSKAADALPGRAKTKAARDAVAAMLILQTYLDKL